MSDLDTSLATLNSAIQFAAATAGASDDKDFIRKENEKAREFTLEMWNRANEFNSPVNQVNRIRAAGLNPALVYGEGAKTLADYVSSPGHSAPNMNTKDTAKSLDFIGNMSMAQQMKIAREMTDSNLSVNASTVAKQEAEENQANSQAKKNEADAAKSNIETTMLSSNLETYLESQKQSLEVLKNENKISAKEYEIKSKELNKVIEEVRKAKANADKAEEEINTQKATTANVKQSTQTLKTAAAANIAQADMYRAEAYKAREQGRTEDFNRQMIASDLAKNEALIDNIHSQTKLNYEQAEKCIAEAAKMVSETGKINYELIRDQYGTNAATILNNHLHTIVEKVKGVGTKKGVRIGGRGSW